MTTITAPPAGNSPGNIDVAQTFAESGVTVSGDLAVDAEELTPYAFTKGSETTGWGSPAYHTATDPGIEFVPNADLDGIWFDLYNDGFQTFPDAIEIQDSVGTTIERLDSYNDPGFIKADLASGTTYRLVGIGNYEHLYENGPSFPYAGTDLDVTNGVEAGGTASEVPNWSAVAGATLASTSVGRVSWTYPPDLFEWDRAVFEVTEGDGTVSVYIEEDQAGGWTEVAGPIGRGDSIPADPSNNVRLRFELGKGSTTNPRVKAAYRRYLI